MVSIKEYLRTSYEPDSDYVDGEIEVRNTGRMDHGRLMGELGVWFSQRRQSLQLKPFMVLTIRTGPTRFRVVDVCVVQPPITDKLYLTKAPYICIEVLSPEDTVALMQRRFDDYLGMGVPNVWCIDPETRRGWSISREGHFEALDGILRTHDGNVSLPLAELFEDEI